MASSTIPSPMISKPGTTSSSRGTVTRLSKTFILNSDGEYQMRHEIPNSYAPLLETEPLIPDAHVEGLNHLTQSKPQRS
jgi:hypothetical protein